MSRQQKFREVLGRAMEEVKSQFYKVGPKGKVGGWHGTTRAQARRVARLMAREAVRADQKLEVAA